MRNKKIIQLITVTSIYIVLCIVFSTISFGPIQLRLSELLCLLTIENPIYIIPVSIGCFISNLILSPLGSIDAIVGTFATIVGCFLGYLFRNIKVKGFPLLSAVSISFVNALLVALELKYVLGNQNVLLYYFVEILISEILILVILGFPIYNKLLKTINKN